jgi:glycosyltransferase involved in cell wall biosynthesis
LETKLSVIIPVFNAERYINNCIENLLEQTIENVEFIFVNDGSTDNSLSILYQYQKKDDRIYILNQNNKGPSSARNLGLSKARGKYIGFVDADDWIEQDMFENLFNRALTESVDLIMCNFIQEFSNGQSKKNLVPWPDGTILDKNNINNVLLPKLIGVPNENALNDTVYGSVWRCLYRKDIIKYNNLHFPTDTAFTEDLIFNIQYLMKANNVLIDGNCYYHYYYNMESATKKYMPRMLDYTITTFEHLNSILTKENIYTNEIQNILAWRWRAATIQCLINVARPGNKTNIVEKVNEIKTILRHDVINKAFRNFPLKTLPRKRKIVYFLVKYRFSLSIYIYFKIVLVKEKLM